jgi:hypothetical protein
LQSNCEFPNPAADPEELAIEPAPKGGGEGEGVQLDSGEEDELTAQQQHMSMTGRREDGAADVFLTGMSDDEDENTTEDDDASAAGGDGTGPRMMEVNGIPCKSCRLLYPREFLKEHERICVLLVAAQAAAEDRKSSGAGVNHAVDRVGSASSSRAASFSGTVPLPAVGFVQAPAELTRLHKPHELIGVQMAPDDNGEERNGGGGGGGMNATGGAAAPSPRPPTGPRRPTDPPRSGSGSSAGRSSRADSASRSRRNPSNNSSSIETNAAGPGAGGKTASDDEGANRTSPEYTDKEMSNISSGRTSSGKKSLFGRLKITESSPLANAKRAVPGKGVRPAGAPPPRAPVGGGGGRNGSRMAPTNRTGSQSPTPPRAPPQRAGADAGTDGSASRERGAGGLKRSSGGSNLGSMLISAAIRPNE